MATVFRRFRDAWLAFWGRFDDRYVRREEIPDVLAAAAEAEARIASTYDVLTRLAARIAKREERAAKKAAEMDAYAANGPAQDPEVPLDKKAALRAKAGLASPYPPLSE